MPWTDGGGARGERRHRDAQVVGHEAARPRNVAAAERRRRLVGHGVGDIDRRDRAIPRVAGHVLGYWWSVARLKFFVDSRGSIPSRASTRARSCGRRREGGVRRRRRVEGSEAEGGGRARAPSRLRDEADVARRVEGRLRRALKSRTSSPASTALQPRRRPRHLRLRVGAVQPERVAVRRRRRAVAQAHAAQLRVARCLTATGGTKCRSSCAAASSAVCVVFRFDSDVKNGSRSSAGAPTFGGRRWPVCVVLGVRLRREPLLVRVLEGGAREERPLAVVDRPADERRVADGARRLVVPQLVRHRRDRKVGGRERVVLARGRLGHGESAAIAVVAVPPVERARSALAFDRDRNIRHRTRPVAGHAEAEAVGAERLVAALADPVVPVRAEALQLFIFAARGAGEARHSSAASTTDFRLATAADPGNARMAPRRLDTRPRPPSAATSRRRSALAAAHPRQAAAFRR